MHADESHAELAELIRRNPGRINVGVRDIDAMDATTRATLLRDFRRALGVADERERWDRIAEELGV